MALWGSRRRPYGGHGPCASEHVVRPGKLQIFSPVTRPERPPDRDPAHAVRSVLVLRRRHRLLCTLFFCFPRFTTRFSSSCSSLRPPKTFPSGPSRSSASSCLRSSAGSPLHTQASGEGLRSLPPSPLSRALSSSALVCCALAGSSSSFPLPPCRAS